ncbi:hypothetical protein D8I35_18615 [Corticibacter populi]|uniref:Transglycosylase SLT domain-containing protein n=1 Tax=Corticibacter populi TaxID=1550736 RepID=A0A3M6QGK3_9BURK|nr:hypothetical protein D8I35_18615 [Corticibacter populi]
MTWLGLLLAACWLAGCTTAPPRNPDDLCSIFDEKPAWHTAALKVQREWGAPVHVPMAIMYQESSFRADAKPPKRYILGLIPWGRVSSAYGYSQALDETWAQYKQETGKSFVSRDSFADSLDFIGWYMAKSRQINGVSLWDGYGQYLNYHEGWTGYQRRSYTAKNWLPPVAQKVQARSQRYASQYEGCSQRLTRRRWLW